MVSQLLTSDLQWYIKTFTTLKQATIEMVSQLFTSDPEGQVNTLPLSSMHFFNRVKSLDIRSKKAYCDLYHFEASAYIYSAKTFDLGCLLAY